jgi:putative endopeptidase
MTRCRLALLVGVLLSLGAACSTEADARRVPPKSTGLDETFLDRRADPCTDFYQFACGTWIRQHPAEPGYVDARFANGDQRNDIYFELVLTDSAEADGDLEGARAYRDACMAVRGGGSKDFSPATSLLHEIAAASTPADIATAVADLHAAHVDALFRASPSADPGDPTRRVLWFSNGGWGLPSQDSYGPGAGLEQPYRDHMSALASAFQLAGLDPNVVWGLESQIAAAAASPTVLRDPVASYNLTDESALEAQVPSFAWSAYFTQRGFGAPAQVNLVEPDFFSALETLLANTPIADLRAYLTWRVLEASASAASQNTIAEEDHFHGEIVDGRTQRQPDEYVCLQTTRSLFGNSLAHAFVDRFVPSGTVKAASKLVDAVREALRTDLQSLGWLDDATRQQATDKLDAMIAKVGYPEGWVTRAEPPILANDSFLEDRFAAARFLSDQAARDLSLPVDRSEWAVTPDTTNAFYSPLRNDITLPVAILEDPFFSVDWPASSKYGAIGAVIGHEMTHGFDDDGRRFDGSGKLANFWTDAVDAQFRDRAACLVDQFGAYAPAPGVHIDGSVTLGENIADLGGLKLAHAAFGAAPKQDSPSASFDPDQAFFVSYAQIWCESESTEALEQQLVTDPHAPAQYRVNGVVRNVPEFAKAFHCPKNAELSPPDRCDIW